MHFKNNLCGILLVFILTEPGFCMTSKVLQGNTRTLAELVHLHTFKFLAILAIPLLFLPLLFLGAISLLFIPFPILSNPATGIAAVIGRRSAQDELELILQEISQSNECIERISCEIGRSINSLEIRGIVDQTLNQLAPYLKEKWKNLAHGYVFGSNGRKVAKNNCIKYNCSVNSDNWGF